MNILLVKGQTQYGALNHFVDQLRAAFEKMGHKIYELDFEGEFGEELVLLRKTPIDMAVTMNGIGRKILQDYINAQDCLVWNFFVDSPIYHGRRLSGQWQRQVSSFIDHNHQRYANTYFENLDNTVFLPHGGSGRTARKRFEDRTNDVVFFGSYYDISNSSKGFLNYNESMQEILFRVAEKLSFGLGTLENLFLEELNRNGVSLSEAEVPGLMEEIEFVDRYVRNFNRIEMLEAMVKNGVHVEVFGEGWDKYQNKHPEYLHVHSGISYDETLEIMGDTKIVVTNLPLFRNGSHERIFNAMLCGAVCLSEKNEYLEQEFIENNEIVFCEYNNLAALPEKVKILLENQALAAEIAQNGYEKAKNNHTWEHRAQAMVMYYEQMPFVKSNKRVAEVEDIDMQFNQVIQFAENNSEEQIYEKIKGTYLVLDRLHYEVRVSMEESYRKYPYFGKLSLENQEFELIAQRAYYLKNHMDDFILLYQKVKDSMSRQVLTNILLHWVTFESDYLQNIAQVCPDESTFLKMDVEGAERYSLEGGQKHMQNERPQLAISIDHGNEDLWKIGRIIDELNDSYDFYIRYYGGTVYPDKIVLYAV